MRLWSLHPAQLDAKGLVALWREGLLARAVLAGETVGYRRHPQLERFLERRVPLASIDCYLSRALEEAQARGYRFDAAKLRFRKCRHAPLQVTSGQLRYEWAHLLAKLGVRDRDRWTRARRGAPLPHPCFQVVPGAVATWERVRRASL